MEKVDAISLALDAQVLMRYAEQLRVSLDNCEFGDAVEWAGKASAKASTLRSKLIDVLQEGGDYPQD